MNQIDTETKKRRGRLRTLRKVVAVAATAVGFGYVFWTLVTNWGELQDLSYQWNGEWIALHFLVVLAFFGSFSFVWRLVMRSCCIDGSARAIVLSAYLPNLYKYIPGKVWAVASRVELLASYTSASRKRASAATVLSYLMEIMGAVPFLFVILWITPQQELRPQSVLVVLIPVILVIAFSGTIVRLISWALRKAGREPLPPDFRTANLPWVLVCYMGYWSLYAASAVFLMRGLGMPGGGDALLVGGVLVAAWLIGFVSLVTPGGIGIREGAMTVLLTPIVGPALAAVIPIVTRLSWTSGELLGAGTALTFMIASRRQK